MALSCVYTLCHGIIYCLLFRRYEKNNHKMKIFYYELACLRTHDSHGYAFNRNGLKYLKLVAYEFDVAPLNRVAR